MNWQKYKWRGELFPPYFQVIVQLQQQIILRHPKNRNGKHFCRILNHIHIGVNTSARRNLDQQEFFLADSHNFLPSPDRGCHLVGLPPGYKSGFLISQTCFTIPFRFGVFGLMPMRKRKVRENPGTVSSRNFRLLAKFCGPERTSTATL